jgi:hypothetical protein
MHTHTQVGATPPMSRPSILLTRSCARVEALADEAYDAKRPGVLFVLQVACACAVCATCVRVCVRACVRVRGGVDVTCAVCPGCIGSQVMRRTCAGGAAQYAHARAQSCVITRTVDLSCHVPRAPEVVRDAGRPSRVQSRPNHRMNIRRINIAYRTLCALPRRCQVSLRRIVESCGTA